MIPPNPPADEPERLALLRSLRVLDQAPDPVLDRITRTAARLFQVPMAMVTLVDSDRQWFMSRVGLDICETPRRDALCGHAILQPGTMVVTDTWRDERFTDNPLVTGAPHIRFYAGRPLRSRHGLALGTLCLIDHQPRSFEQADMAALDDLADMAQAYFHGIEATLETRAVQASLERSEMLFARMVTHAAVGIAVATTDGAWLEMNQRFCDIVGHARASLLGTPIADVVHPDDRASGTWLVRQVIQGRADALSLQLRFVRADGGPSWTQIGASVLRDVRGEPESLVAVVTDINEHKRVQEDLERLQRTLEQRIVERTAELNQAVERLQAEIAVREAAQRALTEEKERFESTLRHASDAFVEVDADDRILFWNRSAEYIFGWTQAEAIGQSLSAIIVPEPMRARHLAAFRRFMRGEPDSGYLIGRRLELTGRRRDGETFPLELTLGTTRVGGRRIANAFLRDISRRKADEQALRESAERLRTITDNAPAMIAIVDRDLRYRFQNHAYTDWFGIAPDALIGTDARQFWGEATYAHLRPALDAVFAGERVAVEYPLPGRNGRMWFYATLVPRTEDDGEVSGFYLLAQDVTERKALYERIEHEATHDPLTALPNRRALMQRIEEAMARVRRHGRSMAVLFMDLDGFKHMNDTLGHEFGDAVLQHFAANVRAAVRDTDLAARLAGDEFVIVLEDLDASAAEQQACTVANAVLDRLRTIQEIQGVAIGLTTSIGAAIHRPQDEETPQELLHRADSAMYRAKAAGKRQVAF